MSERMMVRPHALKVLSEDTYGKDGTMPKRKTEPDYDDLDTHLGRDDVPGDSVRVLRNESGSVLMLPSAYAKLNESQRELISELQHVAAEISRLTDAMGSLVREGRDEGLSWDLLGWSIGRTGRAVSMRFGDDDG